MEFSKLKEAKSFQEMLCESPIKLISEAKNYSKEQIKEMFPENNIAVCDFNVDGIDPSLSYEEQLKQYGLINIDHHSDLPQMERQISSTNLAIK